VGRGAGGGIVASGVVGGEPVPLPAGTCRVEVLSDPPITFDGVVVESARQVRLSIPAEGGT
jgi:hypothetical protein